ncbi:MAG: DUF2461 domain-containing protein [Candidatus Binataceae bacterium]
MSTNAHFTPRFFGFLKELKANNRRDWFVANKPRYESEVRDPMLNFIAEFAPRLRAISRHYRADPRPVGGSMFRIYRDTRFSRDKSPYKTNVGAHFRHTTSKDVHSPGYYLHLSPGEVFVGCGIWHPDSPTAAKIRDAIVARPQNWTRAISSRSFRAKCDLDGDRLQRPPAGYAADHPLIEELKRKDFIASTTLTQADACSARFLDRFVEICQAAAPMMCFLTTALELPW